MEKVKIHRYKYDKPEGKPNELLGEFEIVEGDVDGYSFEAIGVMNGERYKIYGEEISYLDDMYNAGTKCFVEKITNNDNCGEPKHNNIREQSIVTKYREQSIVTEYAEKIVIEYANISGRDDNRPAVREASKRVIRDLLKQLIKIADGNYNVLKIQHEGYIDNLSIMKTKEFKKWQSSYREKRLQTLKDKKIKL